MVDDTEESRIEKLRVMALAVTKKKRGDAVAVTKQEKEIAMREAAIQSMKKIAQEKKEDNIIHPETKIEPEKSAPPPQPPAAAACAVNPYEDGGEDGQPFRAVVEDDRMLRIAVKEVNSELVCRVCLGIIRRCWTVMECLHRFCQDCIEQSLRYGKKECPSCRVSCPSRRNLRSDPMFDMLIKSIYPDIQKAEAEQEAIQEKIINQQNHKAYAKSVEEGASRQRQQSQKKRKRSPQSTDPASAFEQRLRGSPTPVICLALLAHPLLGKQYQLRKPHIRCMRATPVKIILAYLATKLEGKGEFRLSVRTRDGLQPLDPTLSLGSVDEAFWNRPQVLVLYYDVTPSVPSGLSS